MEKKQVHMSIHNKDYVLYTIMYNNQWLAYSDGLYSLALGLCSGRCKRLSMSTHIRQVPKTLQTTVRRYQQRTAPLSCIHTAGFQRFDLRKTSPAPRTLRASNYEGHVEVNISNEFRRFQRLH